MKCPRTKTIVLSVLLALGTAACVDDEGSPVGGFGGSPAISGSGGGGTSAGLSTSGNGGGGTSGAASGGSAGSGGQVGIAGVGGAAGSGGGAAPNAGSGGGLSGGPPKFSSHVAPLLKMTCALADCHDAIKKEHGMDFSSAPTAVHGMLVNKMTADHCNGNMPTTRVMPGQPQNSYMIMLIEAINRCEEVPRMPPPPKEALKPAEILLIREWITAGALND